MADDDRMIDYHGIEDVEVLTAQETGTSLWVNLDGRCRLRIKGITTLRIEDARPDARVYRGQIMRVQLTDNERWWLAGLLGGWLFTAAGRNNPAVIELASSILKKIEGTDKVVIVEDRG